MIDLRGVWLPQIIGYAQLVSDERILRASWIDGDRSETSVTDFDEMMEQIFGLDSETQVELARRELSDDPELIELLSSFIEQLRVIDRFVVDGDLNGKPERIFASIKWSKFRNCARQLEDHATRRGYATELASEPIASQKI